jgi:hypothetical protein
MMSFQSDWWEAFVISKCYEMGDPLAPSEVEGNREGMNRNMRQIFNGTNALKAEILLMSLILSGVISLTFHGNGVMPGYNCLFFYYGH